MPYRDKILILTPLKNAKLFLSEYCGNLLKLTYPHKLISVAFLVSDSWDNTFREIKNRLPVLKKKFRRVRLWKKDFGFPIPPGTHRWKPSIQIKRKIVLAKSRNHLLFRALRLVSPSPSPLELEGF